MCQGYFLFAKILQVVESSGLVHHSTFLQGHHQKVGKEFCLVYVSQLFMEIMTLVDSF